MNPKSPPTSQAEMSHLKYRADIDGLRAIAILLVVAFHASGRFKGGFIGVDIFFVISGYLVSSVIIKSMEGKEFSYKNFYFRRIRRIFPALMVVLIATWGGGWAILFPDEFRQLGKHIAGGNGFVSNIILWSEAGYFDSESHVKPLLQLWSLGIEEQFYIFWPLILGLAWTKRSNALVVITLVGLTSFLYNLYSIQTQSQAAAFYLPASRFWELMVGGVLAYIVLFKSHWQTARKVSMNLQSLLGVVMIGTAFICLDQEKPFPGWWAVLPTVGTFFLILNPGSWINRVALGNRVLNYIGLISYPLYLWHWSILSYASILEFESKGARAACVGVSFLLAIVTYEVIEKATRKENSLRLITGLVVTSVCLLLVGLGMQFSLLTPRNNSKSFQMIAEATVDWDYPNGLEKSARNGFMVYVKQGAPETVLFFGDSHLEQYAPRLVQLINEDPENTKSIIFATRGGCPPIPNVFGANRPDLNPEFKKAMIDLALTDEIDSIVIGGYWAAYLLKENRSKYFYYLQGDDKKFFDKDGIELAFRSLEKVLSKLAKNKKVYLLIDNPSDEAFDPKNSVKGTRLTKVVARGVRFKPYDQRQIDLRTRMIGIAKRSGALVLDPWGHFRSVNDQQCRFAMEDGTPIFKDNDHLRPFYVKKYITYLDVTLRK